MKKQLLFIIVHFMLLSNLCFGSLSNPMTMQDHEGNTPIHFVARTGRSISMLDSLFRFPGININIQNKWGNTPLHEAILTEKHEQKILFIHYFLIQGANVTIKNNENKTVLELAQEKDKKSYDFILFYLNQERD
jgi:ankyrin repeat protein